MYSHAMRYFVVYFVLILALILGCACYFAFQGTNETQYQGEIGTPDTTAAEDGPLLSDPPPVPETLEDDFDLLDPDLQPPEPGDSTGGTPPDTLP